MVDLFISYARADRRLAETLCDDMGARGFDCWWDRELLSGDEFRSTLLARLREAKAVLVIWTDRSIGSRWVCEEAEEAAERHKLVAVCEDGFDLRELPLGFRSFQTVPLSDREGIAAAVSATIGRAGGTLPAARTTGRRRRSRTKAAALAAGTGLAVAASAAFLLFYLPAASSDDDTSNIILGEADWGPRQTQLIALGRRLEAEFQSATDLARPPLTRDAFARPLATIAEIRALDPNNGHVHYFTGAIARWLDPPGRPTDSSHQAYSRYLEVAERVGAIGRTEPGARWCYDRPWGICSERTAWVNHQFAWDYFRFAQESSDPARRRAFYAHAANYARSALGHFPRGFDQGLQTQEIAARSLQGAGR